MAAKMRIVCVSIFIYIIGDLTQFVSADTGGIKQKLKQLQEVVAKQLKSNENLQKRVAELENENQRLKDSQVRMENLVNLHETQVAQLEKETKRIKMVTDAGDHRSDNVYDNSGKDDNISTTLKVTDKVRSIGQHANMAFHASMSNTRCFHTHEPYIFDVEEIDVGNGYNPHDGIYVVPVSGTYVFTFTIAAGAGYFIIPEIIVNGIAKGSTISDSDDSSDIHPATLIILVPVNDGDHVFVRTEHANTCNIMSDVIHGKSTFSGWLLF